MLLKYKYQIFLLQGRQVITIPHYDLDLSNADPTAVEEYSRISNMIEDWSDSHPDPLTDDERDELGSMLNQRAEALSKMLNADVHSIAEDD